MKYIVMVLLAAAAAVTLKQYLDNRNWESLVENKKKEFGQEKSLKNKRSLAYAKTCGSFAVLLVLVTLVPVSMFEGPAFSAKVSNEESVSDRFENRQADYSAKGGLEEYELGEEVLLEEYEEIAEIVIEEKTYTLLEKDGSYYALSEEGSIYTLK